MDYNRSYLFIIQRESEENSLLLELNLERWFKIWGSPIKAANFAFITANRIDTKL